MTVFRPSLPPVSSTTTRMVSLAPGLSAVGAARAVRLRKPGTFRPQATRPLAASDVFRKSRRFGSWMLLDWRCLQWRSAVDAASVNGSIQLKLRQRQHQMAQARGRGGRRRRLGPVDRHRLRLRLSAGSRSSVPATRPARRPAGTGAGRNRRARRRSSCRTCATSAAGSVRRAETRVLGRGQGQGQVLAEQQRLAVEPGRAAVPALDRRRVEDVLAQLLQRRRQGRRADRALPGRGRCPGRNRPAT